MNYTHRASSVLWSGDTYLFDISNSYACLHEQTGKVYTYREGWYSMWRGAPEIIIEELNITLENE